MIVVYVKNPWGKIKERKGKLTNKLMNDGKQILVDSYM